MFGKDDLVNQVWDLPLRDAVASTAAAPGPGRAVIRATGEIFGGGRASYLALALSCFEC